MNKIKLSVLSVFITMCMNECKSPIKDNQASAKPMSEDSFIAKIPITITSKPRALDSILELMTADFNFDHIERLESISKSSDSFRMRVWYELGDTNRVVSIIRKDSKWQGDLYTYEYRKQDDSLFLIIYAQKKDIQPKTSWENVISELDSLKVSTLPDMKEVVKERFLFAEGGKYFNIELAIKGRYRCYNYIEPYHFKEKYWQAGNVAAMLDLFKKEFDIRPFLQYNRPYSDTIIISPASNAKFENIDSGKKR